MMSPKEAVPVTAEVVIDVPVSDVMLTKFDVEVIPLSASVVPSNAKSAVVVNTLFCTNGILPFVK